MWQQAPAVARPNFFIVGAPKCGTTALHHYLSAHPRVSMSEPKEPHYFCVDFPGFRWARSDEEYEAFFSEAGPQSLAIGEASPLYLYSDRAGEEIARFAPGARVVVMLRPYLPYLRSFHNQLLYNRDEVEPDFAVAWRLQKERSDGRRIPSTTREPKLLQYEQVGRVGSQLQRLLDVFPRDRVLVILFEDFVRDTKESYERVLDFLGLPSDGREDFPRVHAAKAHRVPALARLTQRPPLPLLKLGRAVKRRVGLEGWSALGALRRLNTRPTDKRDVPPELQAEISRTFRDDAALLSELLGRDLGHWCP